MTSPTLPHQIPDGPIDITERIIKQMKCPNPDCDASLDITNINEGTKIQCKSCDNVTWLPDYKKQKWWQKPAALIGGALLTYVLGIASSLTVEWTIKSNISTDAPTATDNKNSSITPQTFSKETNDQFTLPKD